MTTTMRSAGRAPAGSAPAGLVARRPESYGFPVIDRPTTGWIPSSGTLDDLLAPAGPSVLAVVYVDGSPTEFRPALLPGGAPSPIHRRAPRPPGSVSGRISAAIHDAELLDLPPGSRWCYLPRPEGAVALVMRMPVDRGLADEQRWLTVMVSRLAEVREADGRMHRVGAAWRQARAGALDAEELADLVDTATDQAVTDCGVPVNVDSARAAARSRSARRDAHTPAGAIRRLYARQSFRGQVSVLLVVSYAVGWLLPFATLSLLWLAFGIDLGRIAFFGVIAVLLITAASTYLEGLYALDPTVLPRRPDDCDAKDPLLTGVWPTVSAVFAAYLPNEVDTLPHSVAAALAQEYPGRIQVIVSYNGADASTKGVERRLRAMAADDDRLVLVGVDGSTSKAQNVNGAARLAEGEVVGIFDADHEPAPGSFARAARWIGGDQADLVQGHSVIRNADASWIAATVAVEFEGIYAVAHPGRAALAGFGIFGGSNGFWSARLLRSTRMRPWMLTEDIDASMRAVLDGARIVSDPTLISRELAPTTVRALWQQRLRWAQGWSQVSRRYFTDFAKARNLTPRQRYGGLWLLGWREVYPWLSMQMVPVLAYQLLVRHTHHIHWFLPIFVVCTLFTTAVGPIQALFGWRLAVPELRTRPKLFLRYLLLTGAIYGEARSVANRCAHVREWLGDVAWRVTPRGVAEVIIPEAPQSFDGASADALGRS